MTAPDRTGWKGAPLPAQPVLLIAAIYCIPILLPGIFGWAFGFLAVPAAYILTVKGRDQGFVTLRNGLLLAGIPALLSGQTGLFIFTLTLLPLGYCLSSGEQTKQGAAKTGAWGVVILALSWFVFWTIYGVLSGVHPYQHLLTMLDSGFAQSYELYRTSTELPPEMQINMAAVILEIRSLIPRILPGILCSTVLVTVWMNQLLYHSILTRRRPDKIIWPPYSTWKLPEQLVWLPISASVLFITGHGTLKDLGLNALLISGTIYFFQGLAVFIHLQKKWKIPAYLRVILYLMLIVQSYGLILISLLGLGETWINLREPKKKQQ